MEISQLATPKEGVHEGYHSIMEDSQRGIVGPSTIDSRQALGYPAPPWPATKPPRSNTWLIAASILAGCALIAGALYFALKSDNTSPVPAAAAPESSVVQSAPIDDSTCESWQAAKLNLDAIPPLPAGWNYETPNIDTYIGNYVAAVSRTLDTFEPNIAPQPETIATAASAYVAAKRLEVEQLASHTFTGENTAAGNSALSTLNQLCNTG